MDNFRDVDKRAPREVFDKEGYITLLLSPKLQNFSPIKQERRRKACASGGVLKLLIEIRAKYIPADE